MHREQQRNTLTTTCGLAGRKHQKICGQAQIKSHGQNMWSEQRTAPFLPQQVLYFNSSSSGCQGPFELKPELKI